MCGIAGIYFKSSPKNLGISHGSVERMVNGLLLGIEPRGRHATGIVSAKGRKARLDKRDTAAATFIKTRKQVIPNCNMILLHTRLATQGSPAQNENNHPVQYGSVYAVHNGHVGNDSELFEEEEITRLAEVDSSVIPALVDKFGLDKVHLALQKLQGGVATAIIDPKRFPHTLVLAKGKNSPVHYFESEGVVIWASEMKALIDAFEYTYGKGSRPSPNKLHHLSEGDLLLMQGGEVEKLRYEVKQYTSTKKSYTSTGWGDDWDTGVSGRSYYVASSAATEARKHNCDGCGHTQFWHNGANYDGTCLALDDQKDRCTCKSYVSKKEDTPRFPTPSVGVAYYADTMPTGERLIVSVSAGGTKNVYGRCDGCETAFSVDTMFKMGGYWWCDACYEGNPELKMPEAPQAVKQLLEAISKEDQPSPEKDEEVTPDELTSETLKDVVLNRMSNDFDVQPTVIEWVLFDATERDISREDSLSSMRNEMETAYLRIEQEVKDEWNLRHTPTCAISEGEENDAASCGVTVFEEERVSPRTSTVLTVVE